MRRYVTLLSFLFLVPFFSFAHGNQYLEFNPDGSDSLKVADVAIPSQVFYAQNDFLGGFDIWYANPGSAGTATFELLSEQGDAIGVRTVSIPTSPITASGTKLHIDLTTQSAVLAQNKYTFRITSSMPELRLYYSNRVQLISYNAPFTSEYIVGVGMLGSEQQPFSFKYALYETNETSAPIISNVAWTVVSDTQMKVTFNTNEAVDYKIEYGQNGQGYTQSTNFLNAQQFCTEGISLCSITIAVSPNMTYQYRLTVKDVWNNQSQITGTFASGQSQVPATPTPTNPAPTPTATASPTPGANLPVISNLRVANVTDRSADVAWTTNEAANSSLIISREVDFSLVITSALDPTMELEHLLRIGDGLSPGTRYTIRVKSGNSAGETTASLSFTTLAQAPLSPTPVQTSSSPPPQPTSSPASTSSPQATPLPTNIILTSSNNESGDRVQWNPPSRGEPTDGYRVDVIDKDGKLIKTVIVTDGTHQADIPPLKEGDKVIVYANNNGIFEKVDSPVEKKPVSDDTFLKRLLALWPVLLIPLGLGGVLWWLRRKNKNVNIKMENNNAKF